MEKTLISFDEVLSFLETKLNRYEKAEENAFRQNDISIEDYMYILGKVAILKDLKEHFETLKKGIPF